MSLHDKIETERTNRRAQVFMSGLLATPLGAIKVIIRDISETGAHVVGERQIPSEFRVELQRGALHAFAKVAWVKGMEAGLRFERALSASELERSMPTGLLRTLESRQSSKSKD